MDTKRTIRRHRGAINAGSMADIAFLLLIFFLVTTTMDSEYGLPRMLAPVAEAPPAPVAPENILLVQLNDEGELLVRDERMDLGDLHAAATAFLTNPEGREDLPRMLAITEPICLERIAALGDGPQRAVWQQRLDAVRVIGPYREPPPQAQMLVQAGSGVAYADYIAVQNVLEGAVAQLRDEMALRAFGKAWKDLDEQDPTDRHRIQAIKRALPLRVGDAELVAR
jgi:biopolymer transport protein ExbD